MIQSMFSSSAARPIRQGGGCRGGREISHQDSLFGRPISQVVSARSAMSFDLHQASHDQVW